MNVRSRYLEMERVLGDAETVPWNLKQNSPITAIELRFQATTGAGTPAGPPLLNDIDNLRVVDGSKQYASAGRAKYIDGMSYGFGHGMTVPIIEVTASEGSAQTMMIYFGRYFGDKEYFLDPRMMNNPQLILTSALTVAANNYTTNTLTCTIIIHTLEGAGLNHMGVMITKEVIAQTIAANAVERVQMPVDYPWWSLGIFGENAAGLPLQPIPTVLNYELDINNGEYVPFEYRGQDLVQDNMRDLGLFHNIESQFPDWAINLGMGLQLPNVTLETNMCAPYGGVFIPFHHIYRNEPLEFNPNDQARLIMTAGATGGVARILLAQLASTGYFGK